MSRKTTRRSRKKVHTAEIGLRFSLSAGVDGKGRRRMNLNDTQRAWLEANGIEHREAELGDFFSRTDAPEGWDSLYVFAHRNTGEIKLCGYRADDGSGACPTTRFVHVWNRTELRDALSDLRGYGRRAAA